MVPDMGHHVRASICKATWEGQAERDKEEALPDLR